MKKRIESTVKKVGPASRKARDRVHRATYEVVPNESAGKLVEGKITILANSDIVSVVSGTLPKIYAKMASIPIEGALFGVLAYGVYLLGKVTHGRILARKTIKLKGRGIER